MHQFPPGEVYMYVGLYYVQYMLNVHFYSVSYKKYNGLGRPKCLYNYTTTQIGYRKNAQDEADAREKGSMCQETFFLSPSLCTYLTLSINVSCASGKSY